HHPRPSRPPPLRLVPTGARWPDLHMLVNGREHTIVGQLITLRTPVFNPRVRGSPKNVLGEDRPCSHSSWGGVLPWPPPSPASSAGSDRFPPGCCPRRVSLLSS